MGIKEIFGFGWTDPKEVFSTQELNEACKKIEAMQVERSAAMQNASMNYEQLQNKYSQMYNQMAAQGMGGGAMAGTFTRDPNTLPLPKLKMEDLDGAAGKATLEELCDLWRARWGGNWVQRKDITDAFYTVCAQRLVASDRVEAHQLADGTHVYRLIER